MVLNIRLEISERKSLKDSSEGKKIYVKRENIAQKSKSKI